MKHSVLKWLFFLVSGLSFAQPVDLSWAKALGGGSACSAAGIATDDSGNTYTTGFFAGIADFDPGAGVYNLTGLGAVPYVYISKIDTAGNFIWAKAVGGNSSSVCEAESIALDSLKNIYIAGHYKGSVDFDPGAGAFTLTATAFGENAFILKLDSLGTFVWAKSVGNGYDQALSIRVDNSGNSFTTGFFNETSDFDPGAGIFLLDTTGGEVFVLKLNANGDFNWVKKLGGYNGTAIALDDFGNVYTSGAFAGTRDFDPGSGTFNLMGDGSDMYLSKLDSLGNFVWALQMGGIGGCFPKANTVDSEGNVLIAGDFTYTIDFDPGIGVFDLVAYSPSGVSETFICKIDSAGNFVWAKHFGGTSVTIATSISTDSSGKIYSCGWFQGTSDFDPGVGVANLTSISLHPDIFLSILDNAGNYIWAQSMGSVGSGTDTYDGGHGICLDGENNLHIVGLFCNTVDFDFGSGTFNISSVGGRDIFILKINPSSVWPGDTDDNSIVNNSDILPIGLFYGQTGPSRLSISNSWQAYKSYDWGVLQASGSDIKHIDSNGDGTIDDNDTLAVNLNFALTHTYIPANDEVRLPVSDLFLVTSSSSYLPGSIVDVEVWAGDATTPITNLYGLAFDINYDASLVQSATESLTYPASWLGTPGTDAITIAKIDALANTAYGAETRINHTNASGFGKIADLKFQLKSSIPANTVMYFSVSGYTANDDAGFPVLFNTLLDSILINPSSATVSEINNETQISIYPNPTSGSFNVYSSEQIKNGGIEIYNTIGELVFSQKIINQQNTIDLKNQASGLYFVKVISDGEVIGMKKIIMQ